ncbi:metallophosphoesterase family protein [Aquibacillus salsiterrae]|uniref:Phosphoesterase n=1 Tax=Aquibacillus salsiterrae TaxID=2950439 RepID=A0A9X4ADW4_9BACI|nr:metallophosphoesterase family protein [Aquibacillus salsiterrae]MDC3415961.1 metallophosphatase family protein [Aquibacillus salsiterrae]
MKYAFISDIHGNANALDAVLDDINKQRVDKIIVLGDIAYRGPEPKRSIELIKSLNTTVVKGNADEWVVRGVRQGEVPDQALELMNLEREWIVNRIDQVDIDFLAGLPTEAIIEVDGVTMQAFHATPTSLFDVVLPDATEDKLETKLFCEKDAHLYLYGHIHKAYTRVVNGKTVVNLGSVGLPFDGVTKASYAIVEVSGGTISTSHRRVAYDYNKTIRQYEDSHYPNTQMMKKIIETGSI